MIKKLLPFLCLLQCTVLFAQAGCTDLEANNYDKNATYNDGSCTYDASRQTLTAVGQLTPKVNESSGIVLSNGYLWTHNDSGNPNAIYKVDTATGNVVQTVFITNYPNKDWEDITADSLYFYIADCGNNDGIRKDLKILKVAKSQFITDTSSIVYATASAINFSYGDQSSFSSSSTHNFDCEAITCVGDSLYLFTKNRGDSKTRFYPLSKQAGTYSIHPVDAFFVNGLITGADYNSKENKLALIGYQASKKNSFIYYLYGFQKDSFFSGNKRRVEIGNSSNDWQTEGICFAGGKRLYISCETSYVPATLYSSDLNSIYKVNVPSLSNGSSHFTILPNPCNGELKILCKQEINAFEIRSLDGRVIFSSDVNASEIELHLEDYKLEKGMYFISVWNAAYKETRLFVFE